MRVGPTLATALILMVMVCGGLVFLALNPSTSPAPVNGSTQTKRYLVGDKIASDGTFYFYYSGDAPGDTAGARLITCEVVRQWGVTSFPLYISDGITINLLGRQYYVEKADWGELILR